MAPIPEELTINSNKSQIEITGVLNECDAETFDGGLNKHFEPSKSVEKRIYILVWRNIILFVLLHLASLYGMLLFLTQAKWETKVFGGLMVIISGYGITAGAHRLWAHRSYKAKWQLRLLLMIFNTIAFQDCVIDWTKNHRVHHKYSETDADPHNAKRGFFFSHMGWLMCKKHPDVITKGKTIDISDLESDPILAFQKKYYLILMPLGCFVLPTLIPMYFWGENFKNSFFIIAMLRYLFVLHGTWLVNSAAHIFGGKPYDKHLNPSENKFVSLIAFGEGWHNYHHVFPWDYKTAELGNYRLNLTTAFIDLLAKIGWAYDLKSVSTEMIEKRVKRTGDGTHPTWGWGDKDQPVEELEHALITFKKTI